MIESHSALMVPIVLTELLSDPALPKELEQMLLDVPLLEPKVGFWQRAGMLRASLIRRGHRPRLADTLIAQICLDHGAGLLTRDRGFRMFARHAGLAIV